MHKEKQRSGVGEGPGRGQNSHGQRRGLVSSVHLASGSSALSHACQSRDALFTQLPLQESGSQVSLFILSPGFLQALTA